LPGRQHEGLAGEVTFRMSEQLEAGTDPQSFFTVEVEAALTRRL